MEFFSGVEIKTLLCMILYSSISKMLYLSQHQNQYISNFVKTHQTAVAVAIVVVDSVAITIVVTVVVPVAAVVEIAYNGIFQGRWVLHDAGFS